jgi:hypothetical protein
VNGAEDDSLFQKLLRFVMPKGRGTPRRQPQATPADDDDFDENTVSEADADEATIVDRERSPAAEPALAAVDAIAREIASKLNSGTADDVQFELNTATIRGLSVRVRRNGPRIELFFFGEEPRALALLSQTREAFRTSLKALGFEVTRMI